MLVVMMVLAALVFALPVLAEGQEGQGTVLLDLTKLAQAIISLAAGIVSLYLVPWLRSKLTNEQLSKAKSWVQIAVFAAEKLYGAGNGDTLLLAAGQLLREMLFAVHDRHPFHCFLYLFLSLGSRYTHVEQRKFYILVYIQLVDQIETLEDEPDNPFAQFRPLGFRISGYFDPVQVIFSAGRVVEQS